MIFKNSFLRYVMLLAGGTASAQLVNILSIPLLTRVYTPSEFGIYAIFNAINAILSVLCTLKYENAILAVRTNTRAKLALINVVVISFIITSTISLMVLFLSFALDFKFDDLTLLIIASFLSIILGAWYQAYYAWNNRNMCYKVMSRARLISAICMSIFTLLYGYYVGGIEGLLFGTIIGLLVNLLYLKYFGAKINLKKKPSFTVLFKVSKKLKRFPQFLIFSSLFDRTSAQVHLFVFAQFYETAVSGSIALYNKAISLPSTIIGSAVGDVFKRQASEELRTKGECLHLFFKTALMLFIISAPITVAMILYAPDIFAFVFSEEWRQAGEFAQILAINFCMAFTVSPLSNLIYLEDNQKYDLALQLLLLSLLIVFMGGAVMYLDLIMTLWAFVISYFIKYLVEFYICFRIARGDDRNTRME